MIKHQSDSAEHHLPTHEQTHASHYVADSHCVPTAQRSEPQLFPGQSRVFAEIHHCASACCHVPPKPHIRNIIYSTWQCIQTTSSISKVLFLPDSILFTLCLTQLKIWMRLYRRDRNAGWGDGWVISGGIWLHCSRNSLIPPLLCSLHCSLIYNRSHNWARSGRSIK